MKENGSYCNLPVLMLKENMLKGMAVDLSRSGLLEPCCSRGRQKARRP